MTTQQIQELRSCAISAISKGIAQVAKQPELTTRGTPRKRQYKRLIGLTPEQKLERHRAQMRDHHKRHKMSIDTANQIINEQEDAIAELKHKLFEMTDARDLALAAALEMLQSLRRIECCEDLEFARKIASRAIDDYHGK